MKHLDTDILAILEKNARLGNEDIALMTGQSKNVVQKTIDKLEKNGTILQYTTIINEAYSSHKIRALIQLNVRPEKKKGFDSIAKRICQYENVVEMYLISGQFDFLIVVEGNSLQEISSFVADKLASLENVLSTTTYFILKKYKEKGVMIEDKPEEKRLVMSP